MARTKRSTDLSLADKLSRLRPQDAKKLLGEEADTLLARGGSMEIEIDEQVKLDDSSFSLEVEGAMVVIRLEDSARKRLCLECSACSGACEHMGAALSLILEEKLALGLSAVRPEEAPLGMLSEADLVERAVEQRRRRASEERMVVESADESEVWTDYLVTNRSSGRAYRVALRGFEPGQSYCSCPDYRKNRLGTCKHIIKVQRVVKRRFDREKWGSPYERRSFAVHVSYAGRPELRFLAPESIDPESAHIVKPLLGISIEDVRDLLVRVRKLTVLGYEVTVYPDAREMIEARLERSRLESLAAEIRRDPASHPLRRELLDAELLPYQLDGIAFCVGAGRAVLADDMGLGKTIQGIGFAELLAREASVSRVLVICPATLKAQWRSEIRRFSDRSVRLVLGPAAERAAQYDKDCFFTVCNYEQVLRDITSIEKRRWDLIVLDEAQRIKNWEAKTTRIVKGLRSRFALALTGTPLENRLDDLFSVVEFVDEHQLGPAFRFFNRHRVVDERGRVLGYEGLDEVREKLAPILLRRTRSSVMDDLPERSTSIVRVTPTAAQREMHEGFMLTVNAIVNKKWLTEMDLLRLQKALLMCRMTADSTSLVDKRPEGSSSKLERLEELLEALARESDRKIVLFSEWTTMLGLVEPLLERHGLDYVRLDGSIPQKKRQALVNRFRDDEECRVFVTTNAGSTGLNLQAANTVVNVDLPWNPAVLEQRIARAHRMGQRHPVQVFLLVTEETIEEKLLSTLSAKHQLSLAALDMDSDVDEVQLESGMEELKRRLELLLGAEPDAPVDDAQRRRAEEEAAAAQRSERVSLAGGRLIGAAFEFLGELLPESEETETSRAMAERLKNGFEGCLERDEQGRVRMSVTFDDTAAIGRLADTVSRLAPFLSS